MLCPACGGDTGTLETRKVEVGARSYTRRRRECRTCSKRFSTAESIVPDGDLADIVGVKAQALEAVLRSVAALLDAATGGRASDAIAELLAGVDTRER